MVKRHSHQKYILIVKGVLSKSIILAPLILIFILVNSKFSNILTTELVGENIARASHSTTRTGAWVDTLIFSEQPSVSDAVELIRNGDLELHVYGSSDPILFDSIKTDLRVETSFKYSIYHEISYNPAVCHELNKLNPLNNTKIREATNRLYDRQYIDNTIFGGLTTPDFLPFRSGFPEYARYEADFQALETTYAYDFVSAKNTITNEMNGMGATLDNGKWKYQGQPVTLIALIRTEDLRTKVGDYVADQLEAVGFTIDRQYKTNSQASALWRDSDPADCLWHLYTGGWVNTEIGRDEAGNFNFFYTQDGLPWPLWQSYQPTPAFLDVSQRLNNHDYTDMAEREQLFTQAMSMALSDPGSGSVRIFLHTVQSFYPRAASLSLATDMGNGLQSDLWPYTLRFDGQEGGIVRLANIDLLIEPWNPVAGSTWIYDQQPIRASFDEATLSDPDNGLPLAQRIEHASVTAVQGLPITKTLDWVDLSFTSEIQVPGDAWVDWDATNQVFIKASEKFPETQTALVKTTLTYPSDLFSTIYWHDGSSLDIADFVMLMIMNFDRAKPQSAIYDESAVSRLDQLLSHLKGFRILSNNPLVIETYEDQWYIDAETIAANAAWWPVYPGGPGAWHNMALGVRAEAAGQLAFSLEKADQMTVSWMNFIGGDSLPILASQLNQAKVQNYIPYAPTLGLYVSTSEAQDRWTSLDNWYDIHSHFWLGTGPFYLDHPNFTDQTIIFQRFTSFPDQSGKWDQFQDELPSLGMNYQSGSAGSFFTVNGSGFPVLEPVQVFINGDPLQQQYLSATTVVNLETDKDGKFTFLLDSALAEDGLYYLTCEADLPAVTTFRIDENEPLRPKEGEGLEIQIPPDSAHQYFLQLPRIINEE